MEDNVTATKIRGSSTLTKRAFVSGLIMLISIVLFLCYHGDVIYFATTCRLPERLPQRFVFNNVGR